MARKSTTVRTMKAKFAVIGFGIRTLARFAPRAADRAVLRLFSTPMRISARTVPAEANLVIVPFEGRELAVWSLGAGPAVLLVHGWSGSAADFAPLAGVLRRAGYRTVFFDMPAHGRSTGRTTDLPQMSRAVRAVAEFVGAREPLHAAVGHSLGGAAVTMALRDGMRAGRAVLIAPPGGPEVYLDRLTTALGLPSLLREQSLRALAEYAGGSLNNVSSVAAARSLSIPGLIVHDRTDREVSWEEGRAIAESWTRSELFVTEGLGHRRLLSDGQVLERVLDFVAGRGGVRLPAAPERAAGASVGQLPVVHG